MLGPTPGIVCRSLPFVAVIRPKVSPEVGRVQTRIGNGPRSRLRPRGPSIDPATAYGFTVWQYPQNLLSLMPLSPWLSAGGAGMFAILPL